MSYARFFMPLIQEAKGYEFKGRSPAGRCIVEERNNTGKLSMWVQDLKPQTKYGIYLVFAQAQHYFGLHMGPLDVDDKGKAEFRREILPEDLHSFALQEVVTVAVIAPSEPGVVSPLCGYRSAQVSWRHRFSMWKKEEPTPVPVAEEPQAVEVKQTFAEAGPVPVTVEAPHIEEAPQTAAPEPSPIEEPQTTVPEPPSMEEPPVAINDILFVAEEPEPVPAPVVEISAHLPPPRAKKPSATLPPTTSPETPNQSQAYTSTIQLIEAIFNANTPCEPFAKQTHEIKWVRCNLPEHMPLPSDHPHLMSEPFMQAAWADHEHFILGITIDTQPAQYVIGIPGTYTQGNKAIAKRLGFLKFKCHNKDRPSVGSEGYWLMFVDL